MQRRGAMLPYRLCRGAAGVHESPPASAAHSGVGTQSACTVARTLPQGTAHLCRQHLGLSWSQIRILLPVLLQTQAMLSIPSVAADQQGRQRWHIAWLATFIHHPRLPLQVPNDGLC